MSCLPLPAPPAEPQPAFVSLPPPPEDGQTGQRDPPPALLSDRESHSSRQADAGSSPGTVLYNTAQQLLGRGDARCLAHPHQAHQIVSTGAARSPHWSSCAPNTLIPAWLPPHNRKSPSSCPLSPAAPPSLHTARLEPCWLARNWLHSSQGVVLGAGAKAKQQQLWGPGGMDELG